MSSHVEGTAIVEPGVELGEDVRIWHFCHVRSGARLGKGVSLGKGVYIDRDVSIGAGTRIQNGVSVYSGVDIAPWCFIGPHVVFTNDLVPRSGVKEWMPIRTVLETGMSIGAGCVVVCGVRVGAFALAGAGSVVTSDIPPFHLVSGTPARIMSILCPCGQQSFPLGTLPGEVLNDCCRSRLVPEALTAASEALRRWSEGPDEPARSR